MKNHKNTVIFSILVAVSTVTYAQTEEKTFSAPAGFYGGVSIRDRGTEATGLSFGAVTSVWNRYVAPVTDEAVPRALVYGGYRWRNDIAVEASVNSSDRYALRPSDGPGGPHGVGLNFGAVAGTGDAQSRTWNLDVYTSWTFYRAFALYGRLGYALSEPSAAFVGVPLASADRSRLRDGVNVGLGLRYDVNPALGLRLEYGRFGRFGGEVGTTLPESDQVSFGVQYRF